MQRLQQHLLVAAPLVRFQDAQQTDLSGGQRAFSDLKQARDEARVRGDLVGVVAINDEAVRRIKAGQSAIPGRNLLVFVRPVGQANVVQDRVALFGPADRANSHDVPR